MRLSIYQVKPDQGRITRGSAFWLSALLIYYGCRTLYFFLSWDWAQKNFLEDTLIPVVNVPLNMTLIISTVVFLLMIWVVIKLINSEKLGNLLIETETEMKKVTWPSFNESFNSSIVVLIAVIFFLIFLGLADFCLNKIFAEMIFGAG